MFLLNLKGILYFCIADEVFTSHNVSIKSVREKQEVLWKNSLHPTMFLLNLRAISRMEISENFTSHNVSIKSVT